MHASRSALKCALGPLSVAILSAFAPVATQAAPAAKGPTMAAIRVLMQRTHEVKPPMSRFAPMGRPLTIADGRGTGTLTAIVGVRSPTADAYGQLVFFWHNTTFIGLDSEYEKTSIMRVHSGAAGNFEVTYAHYAANNALCCPKLKPVVVDSGWSGKILISNGVPPAGPGNPIYVKVGPAR